ncbi:DsbA family protein [Pseudosulfitobacter sp. DSM 107133]|jgi:protein-disulfide isomerase|uniref:DsbA family protein n=1 Tax=Pseudosulfitobacter sp. DSM 107133 TaxID=2883100 RepID=UPI000DF2C36B|nr:DsbA family protein [Pseudosulfitobacter sp. DSM 107133]UOA28721.1 Disulfide bond formation protein D [Pseudosulfitobacter sp. DSM 107133]
MKRLIAILVAVVVVAGAGWYLMGRNTVTELAGTPIGSANAEEIDSSIDISDIQDMTQGNPDAPVTMIEYASYTCPHCAAFNAGPYKQLKKDYIDTGKINFIYREVYFDGPGVWASLMARCAGPEKFFGITDLLYASQSTWANAGGRDPVAISAELKKIGRLAGMDGDAIDACMQDEAQAKKMVQWFQVHSTEDEITGTPSFVINGKTYSNMPYDQMKTLLDEAGAN